MVKTLRIVGGAGTGKTSELLRLMTLNIERGHCDAFSIGFVTFTRAARQEAMARAAVAFDLSPHDLEQWGWFRTLHGICYRQIGVGKELLTDTKESDAWISEALGEEFSRCGAGANATGTVNRDNRIEYSLACWDVARNSLEPLRDVCERTQQWNTPDPDTVIGIIEQYEFRKRIDGRCDFSDLLGRFGGIQFGVDGHSEVNPSGEVPNVPVWFLDESQDQSALSDRVARRLVTKAHHAYIVGDPFQSIYSFAGSDSQHFMGWPADRQEILRQSFRCPSRILEMGERVLSGCSNYWDRGILPREEGGEIAVRDFRSPWEHEIDPRESLLLLARTNYQAGRIAKRLDQLEIPWQPTDGSNGGWKAPARNSATIGMIRLAEYKPCTALQWRDILKNIPQKLGDEELLTRGAKTNWPKLEIKPDETRDWSTIPEWGAEDGLRRRLMDDCWQPLIRHADKFCRAYARYGEEVCLEPRVKVGTIHSVKGSEADHVMVLLTTSKVVDAGGDPDEERRIGYVAITRARKSVTLLDENQDYSMRHLLEAV